MKHAHFDQLGESVVYGSSLDNPRTFQANGKVFLLTSVNFTPRIYYLAKKKNKKKKKRPLGLCINQNTVPIMGYRKSSLIAFRCTDARSRGQPRHRANLVMLRDKKSVRILCVIQVAVFFFFFFFFGKVVNRIHQHHSASRKCQEIFSHWNVKYRKNLSNEVGSDFKKRHSELLFSWVLHSAYHLIKWSLGYEHVSEIHSNKNNNCRQSD